MKGLWSYVKFQRHLFKSITKFLSYFSRAVAASPNSWLNWILLRPLALLALPLQQPYHQTYPLSLSVDMPVTELPVPVYPPTYQQDNFAIREHLGWVADGAPSSSRSGIPRPTTRHGGDDLCTLPNPQEVTLPETIRTWKILETLKDSTQWVMTVGPHYQSHHLPPLDQTEANTSDRMCLPFQIRPCETRVQAMHLVNSFMYHDESIVQVYEGASWAFPVEMLEDTFMMRVHFQGFEILR